MFGSIRTFSQEIVFQQGIDAGWRGDELIFDRGIHYDQGYQLGVAMRYNHEERKKRVDDTDSS